MSLDTSFPDPPSRLLLDCNYFQDVWASQIIIIYSKIKIKYIFDTSDHAL